MFIKMLRHNIKNLKKLIIWDWDGTLVNTVPIIEKIVDDLAKQFEVSYTLEKFRECTRISWHKSFIPIFGQRTTEAVKIALEKYEKLIPKIKLIENAQNTLQHFKTLGCTMVVVSNKSQSLLNKEIDFLHFREYFYKVISVTEGVKSKPDIDMLVMATKDLDIPKEYMVLVGDSIETDIKAAKNFEISAILYNPNHESVPEQFANVSQINSLVELENHSLLTPNEVTSNYQLTQVGELTAGL